MKSCCARYAFSFLSPASISRTALTTSRTRARLVRTTGKATMATVNTAYAQIPKKQPGDEADDVLFNSLYGVRTIELNRPKKLNSLNGSMARKILPRLREWEKSQMANVIMITGSGSKAFCAGGDVVALAIQNKDGAQGQKASSEYFALEYTLDHLIATYSKPYVAVMDGITMGGGVGLSVHAPFRIATEKTVFAMPETTIGFFPDVGGGFFLPRLDGEIGTYLALTSERLMGVQAFYAGIATHYLDSSVLAQLTTRLSELQFQDFAPLNDRLKIIDSTIAEFVSELPSPDSYEGATTGNLTGSLRQAIDRCFKFDTVEEILQALEQETSSSSHTNEPSLKNWASATIKTINDRSPTSLKVTLKQLRAGKSWDITTAFNHEHEMAARFMQHPDFVEGVEAKLVRRSKERPNWQPGTLDQVGEDTVAEFFTLPTGFDAWKPLEPLNSEITAPSRNYQTYPHAQFALPQESIIAAIVRNLGRNSSGSAKEAVMQEVLRQWNNKAGVRQKVEDVLARNCTVTDVGALIWKGNTKAKL